MASLKADDIIDRQRMRRKVTFWRILALVAALIAIGTLARAVSPDGRFGRAAKPQVARFAIEGTITENEKILERLKDLAKADHVKGVILTIDSPGGTTTGGEAIFDAVRALAEKKPVTAQIGTLAASAGYMIAAATDHIVARKSSIVGSIGVLFQYPNFKTLLDNLGIDVRTIKSSPLKAEPGFFGDPPPGAEDMIRRMIMDSYDWFKGLVAERRGFTAQQIAGLADGSIFTGRQALDNGLVDALGGEDEARKWLTEKGVDADLETVLWEVRRDNTDLFSPFARSWLARQLGFGPLADPLTEALQHRLMLDGLVSVWHVGPAKQEAR